MSTIRFTTIPEEATIVTHSENFHADEMFCIAALSYLFDEIVVYRSPANLPEKNKFRKDVIILDIGCGKFDHHQGNGYHYVSTPQRRPVPYASFGLIWKVYGKILCMKLTNNNVEKSKIVWNYIEKNLVMGIDAYDNGIYPKVPYEYAAHKILTVSSFIKLLNPEKSQDTDYTPYLENAVFFCKLIFDICLNKALRFIEPINQDSDTCDSSNSHNPYSMDRFSAESVFGYYLYKRIYPETPDQVIKSILYTMKTPEKYHPTNSDPSKKRIPYSSVGYIWEKHGHNFCSYIFANPNDSEYLWNYIRTRMIAGIDAINNGILPVSDMRYDDYSIITIADLINSLKPKTYSKEGYAYAFSLALKIVDLIFSKLCLEVAYRLASRDYIMQKIETADAILVLDKHVHWKEWLFTSKSPKAKQICFVISPSENSGYIVQLVPDNTSKSKYKISFPKKWLYLNGDKLREETQISTLNFIHHSNGFMAMTEDLDGAIKLARKAIEIHKKEKSEEEKMKYRNYNPISKYPRRNSPRKTHLSYNNTTSTSSITSL